MENGFGGVIEAETRIGWQSTSLKVTSLSSRPIQRAQRWGGARWFGLCPFDNVVVTEFDL